MKMIAYAAVIILMCGINMNLHVEMSVPVLMRCLYQSRACFRNKLCNKKTSTIHGTIFSERNDILGTM